MYTIDAIDVIFKCTQLFSIKQILQLQAAHYISAHSPFADRELHFCNVYNIQVEINEI